MSSTGSTNTIGDLSKFKTMKDMLKMKHDQLKMYKDSFAKTKPPP